MKDVELPDDYEPGGDKDFMGPRHRLYFRQRLVGWRDEILRDAQDTIHHLQESEGAEPDMADRATTESERALELRTRDRQRKLIAKIESALQRIEDGSYGYCEETGVPIGLHRLVARPIATLSIEAQERHERRERTYRDD